MKKQLYLFRHGESEWNKIKKIQGLQDIPLTSLGIEQAKRIPKYLKAKNLGIIYSSHLTRAFKTGEIVAKKLGIKIVKNKDLREDSSDILDGLFKTEAVKKFGDKYEIYWHNDDPKYDNIRFGKGESKIEARQRMLNIISKLSLESSCSTIGFSTHGFVLKQVLIACGERGCVDLKNCEIVHIEFDTNKYCKENLCRAFKFIERIRTDK